MSGLAWFVVWFGALIAVVLFLSRRFGPLMEAEKRRRAGLPPEPSDDRLKTEEVALVIFVGLIGVVSLWAQLTGGTLVTWDPPPVVESLLAHLSSPAGLALLIIYSVGVVFLAWLVGRLVRRIVARIRRDTD